MLHTALMQLGAHSDTRVLPLACACWFLLMRKPIMVSIAVKTAMKHPRT
jgi:hypothetical protein